MPTGFSKLDFSKTEKDVKSLISWMEEAKRVIHLMRNELINSKNLYKNNSEKDSVLIGVFKSLERTDISIENCLQWLDNARQLIKERNEK